MQLVKNLAIIFDPICHPENVALDDQDDYFDEAVEAIALRFKSLKIKEQVLNGHIIHDFETSLNLTKDIFRQQLRNHILVCNEKFAKDRSKLPSLQQDEAMQDRRSFQIFEAPCAEVDDEDEIVQGLVNTNLSASATSDKSKSATDSYSHARNKPSKDEFHKLGFNGFEVHLCDVLHWVATLHVFQSFPAFVWLAKLAVILPFQTVEVERSFSLMKLIKNPLRNQMQSEHLNALMRIGLDITVDIDKFDEQFENFIYKCLQYWLASPQHKRNPVLSDRQKNAEYMIDCWQKGLIVRFGEPESKESAPPATASVPRQSVSVAVQHSAAASIHRQRAVQQQAMIDDDNDDDKDDDNYDDNVADDDRIDESRKSTKSYKEMERLLKKKIENEEHNQKYKLKDWIKLNPITHQMTCATCESFIFKSNRGGRNEMNAKEAMSHIRKFVNDNPMLFPNAKEKAAAVFVGGFFNGNQNFEKWKGRIEKHYESTIHQRAYRRQANNVVEHNINRIFSRLCNKEEKAIIVKLKIAFGLCKQSIAIRKASFFNRLFHNANETNSCFSSLNATYDSIFTNWQYVDSINRTLLVELMNEIKDCDQIAILVDETNDIAVKSQLCIYIRFWCNRRQHVQVRFLKIVELERKTHLHILEEIKKVMDEFKIDKQKVIGLGVDGALMGTVSVEEGGMSLSKRFENHCMYASSIHCITHRLSLVFTQASSCIDFVKLKMAPALISIWSYFHFSSTRTSSLVITLLEAGLKEVKITKGSPSRWLSTFKSVSTIKNVLHVLLRVWHYAEDDSAIGLIHTCSDYNFILGLLFMEEVHTCFSNCSQVMQMKLFSLAHYVKVVADLATVIASWQNVQNLKFLKGSQQYIDMINDKLEDIDITVAFPRVRTYVPMASKNQRLTYDEMKSKVTNQMASCERESQEYCLLEGMLLDMENAQSDVTSVTVDSNGKSLKATTGNKFEKTETSLAQLGEMVDITMRKAKALRVDSQAQQRIRLSSGLSTSTSSAMMSSSSSSSKTSVSSTSISNDSSSFSSSSSSSKSSVSSMVSSSWSSSAVSTLNHKKTTFGSFFDPGNTKKIPKHFGTCKGCQYQAITSDKRHRAAMEGKKVELFKLGSFDFFICNDCTSNTIYYESILKDKGLGLKGIIGEIDENFENWLASQQQKASKKKHKKNDYAVEVVSETCIDSNINNDVHYKIDINEDETDMMI